MKKLLAKIREILRDRRNRRLFTRVVSVNAAIVVFVTTYALVLPAITMETQAACGIPAHQHDDSCYEEVLTCDLPESDGHTHDESCYTVTQELVCGLDEHIHSPENGCYDEDGNLICTLKGHAHIDSCYKEKKTLTCGQEESKGHHHDASCYERVLTCGLEAHTHSAECYRADNDSSDSNESSAVAASTGAAAVEIGNGDVNSAANTADGSASGDVALTDDSSTAATTGVLPETIAEENLSEGYVPTLDSLNMAAVLTQKTGFYYYHAENNTETPANSEQIDSWKKLRDNDPESLAPADLVRAYFAYTIPAGSLNETNQIARYRLPSNLHLTDDQIIAINQNENGIASQFVNYDTLEITDSEKYDLYRGAEAVEGTRTPDQTLAGDAQEYISAVVKAENVYDVEGLYGEKGAYLGQDLIFIFTPYTIEKNQNTYDSEGNPTSAGHKVTGWFACDFNMDQIDWVETKTSMETATATDADADLVNAPANTSVEKTAEILFAAQDNALNIKEISQTLKLVETIETPEEAVEEATADMADEAADEAVAGEAPAEENAADETVEEAATEETASDATEADLAADNEKAEAASTDATTDVEAKDKNEEPDYKAGTLKTTGTDYTITLDYTADACIPENAELKIREITKDSDPEAYAACLEQAKDQVVDKSAEANTAIDQKASRFFDIEIVVKNEAGEENSTDSALVDEQKIEPKAPVNVNIQLSNAGLGLNNTFSDGKADSAEDKSKQKEPTILHFAEQGIEKIESTTNDGFMDVGDSSHAGDTKVETSTDIRFEAESFSVYGVVYTSLSTTYISASGETYEITVTYDADAQIPEGSKLKVEEITPGSEEYTNYLKRSENRLNLENGGLSFARFFDIEIVDTEGNKVEPGTSVQTEITYTDAVEVSDEESLSIIHFADSGTEVIDDITLSDDNKKIQFQQNSFSVTGTIVGRPSNGQQRMIVLKDGNRYYIVNNDATLTEVGYENNTVSVVEPMLWTFRGNNIFFNSEATGFNTNYTASDWYRRYLNPGSPIGTTEEVRAGTVGTNEVGVTVTSSGSWQNPNDGQMVEINSITNRQNALSQTSVTIDSANGTSTLRHGDTYFGIQRDENETPIRLIPQTEGVDRAQFVFAEASKVPSGVHLQNAVNHIDIAIQGATEVKVPLAYGTYYLEDGTPVHINSNTTVTLSEDQATDKNDLKITADDMKRATIMAYDKEGNEIDDAFYITGFSQNATTNLSEVQVRIEGAFKVAQPEKDNPAYKTIDGRQYDGSWTWPPALPDTNYINAVRQARLNNIIDYRLTVVKPVTYQLVDTQGRKLYVDKNQTPLYVSVDVAFSGSFNYWDYGTSDRNHGNECPPLENNPAWRAGDIPNHDLSGMDFRLIGYANDENSPLVAIEIMKRIVDEKGNLITLGEPVTNYVDIYENKDADRNAVKDYKIDPVNGTNPNRDNDEGLYDGYTHLREKEVIVEAGSAQTLIYDYNVSDAMYYVQERNSEQELPEVIKDNHNEEWTYVKSYIETEYVRRGYGGYDNNTLYPDPMHVSDDYYRGDEYKSSPEVLGWFDPVTGAAKKSGFLEFFIYNVYSKGKMLEVEKQWLPKDGKIPEGAVVTVDLYYAKGENKQFPSRDEYEKVIAGQNHFDANMKTSLTLTEDNNWQDAFEGLPETVTEGGKVYDLDYYAKEVSVKIPGPGKDEVDESAIDITNAYNVSIDINNGKEIIRNEREEVSLDADKKWAEGTVIPEGAEVTFELRFATRPAVTSNGTEIAEGERESWPNFNTYAPVKTTSGFAAPFIKDPGVDETKIITTITLDADDSVEGKWEGVFNNLPKYLITEDGGVLEVDYYAEETAVKVPAPGRTVVDDQAVDVTDDYYVTVEKEDGESADNDGTVTITNEQNETRLDVHKTWAKGSEAPEGTKVKVGLKFAARMITDKNGRKITNPTEWPEKTDYINVTHGNTDQLTVEGTDSTISVSGLTVKADAEVELSANDDNPQNRWNGSFTGLPKCLRDSEGNTWELDYFAVETAVNVPGADSSVVNKIADYIHIEEKTEAAGQNAASNDGTVTITNKEDVVVEVEKKWNPENPPTGAEAVVQLKRYKVDQTPDQIKTQSTIVKVWDDDDDQDGKRPESLVVTLTGGQINKSITLNDANNWRYTESDLQAYDQNGDQISYTWTETSVPEGYSLSGATVRDNVTTLTNSYTPGKTSATVRIDWQDGDNRDGYRPDSVVVTLDQNGQKVTLNDENGWTATISGLPEYKNKNKIIYTWTVDTWTDGNQSKYTGNGKSEHEADQQSKIIYTHDPEMTTMKVRIVWDDNNNEDGSRPEGVNVKIANDQSKEVLLNEGDSWAGAIELFKNENGQPIDYSWSNPIIAGYTQTSKETDNDGTVVMTYHHDPIPPKDYVTVTVHTILKEAEDGYYTDWDNNGWQTVIYDPNVQGYYGKFGVLKGVDVTTNYLKSIRNDENYLTRNKWSLDKAPVYFDVDQNSPAGFHYNFSGTDVSLVDITSNGDVVLNKNINGGNIDITFTTGQSDVDIYIVLKGKEEKLPEESTVYVRVDYNPGETNIGKTLTIPVNSDVLFNYDAFEIKHQTYTETVDKPWELYYYDKDANQWKSMNPPVSGDNPPVEDVVLNVGYIEKYCFLIKNSKDDNHVNDYNIKLERAALSDNTNTDTTLTSYSTNSLDAINPRILNASSVQGNVPVESYDSGSVQAKDALDLAANALKQMPSFANRTLLGLTDKQKANPEIKNRTTSSSIIKSSPVSVPEGYVPDTSFDTPAVTLTLKEGEGYGWKQSFPAQDKYDKWGRAYIYYVDEIDFKPEGYVTDSIVGNPNNGETVVITNKEVVENGSVKVTKAFAGIDSLPDTFTITANYLDKTVTLTKDTVGMTGTGSAEDPYTWVINEIPVGTVVTFTETGYVQEGYSVTVNGNATASPVTAVAAETVGSESTASFENAYTKNPGDIELTKVIAGEGADPNKQFEFTIALTAPAGKTLSNSYVATHSGDSTITTATITDGKVTGIKLKGGETYAIRQLPAGTSYTITETDYSAEGYTQSVSGGLSGTISGGTETNAVTVTNTYSAVDVTVLKIDETTRNSDNPGSQKKLSDAKFKLYRLSTPPGGGAPSYTVYPDTASCEKTTNADGVLEYDKLPNGQYKIEESKVPDGYVTEQKVEFYFTVSTGSVLTWTDSEGIAIENQSSVVNKVGYLPASKTFTVGNTPGAELPHTGGPGTTLLYLLGLLLTCLAGIGMMMKRRRENAA